MRQEDHSENAHMHLSMWATLHQALKQVRDGIDHARTGLANV
jgi:hypothetical protein